MQLLIAASLPALHIGLQGSAVTPVQCIAQLGDSVDLKRLPGVAETTSKPRDPLEEAYPPCLPAKGRKPVIYHGLTRDQGAHPRRKLPFADLAHLEPEAAQKTPQAEF